MEATGVCGIACILEIRSEAAAACVPGGPSIACSTPAAIAWDSSFAANADPSGRAVLGIHKGVRLA